jgi:probable phosphoglycerate mutase
LRHGQSEANVKGVIASNPDIAVKQYGLSPVGIEQAREAGRDLVQRYLRQYGEGEGGTPRPPVVVLLSSDLLRARQTAEIARDAILDHNNKRKQVEQGSVIDNVNIPLHAGNIVLETRLRERGFGDWDGTSDSNYQRVWEDDAVDSSHSRRGVESVDSVMSRATQAVIDWDQALSNLGKAEGEGDTPLVSSAPTPAPSVPPAVVVCIAHGDVLQILQAAFQKMDGTKHRTLPHLETATLRPLLLSEESGANSDS